MEILSSIWSALITENERMTLIITFPLLFIEVYLSLYLFTSLLNVICSKKQKCIYVIAVSIIFFLSNLFIVSPINLIINYVFLFLIIHKIFKLNILKSILAILIPFSVSTLCGTLIMNPILKIFNITYYQLSVIPLYRFIYLLFLYGVMGLLVFIIKFRKISIPLLDDLGKNDKKTILINLILGLLTLCIQLFLTFYYINTYSIIFTLLNFVSLLSYFFISFYSLTRVMKLHVATRDLENAESYNNSLTFLYDNVKGFKHDFNNTINTIGGYIRSNDMEGLKKYYYGLETDCFKVNNVEVLNPNIINNPGIYNLIVSKYQKATELNIKINFEFFFDFDTLNMPIYEFSRILGILLDNAIEAAKVCDDKEILLMFRDSRKDNTQIISIENTYANKDVDTKTIFEKGVSGKENHTGIGLWEVDQILKKNNNVALHTTKDDRYFKQQLEIRY